MACGARLLVMLILAFSGCAPGAPAASPVPPAGAAPPADYSAAPPSAAEARTLPPAPDRPIEKVIVGVTGGSSDVVFYFAQENGYFERLRLAPQFERFDSGGRMVASLATNQIEVAGGSPSVGLYNAIARGVGLKLVGDRASSAPGHDGWRLLLRKELAESGAVQDWADLRGRHVAMAARGIGAELVLGRALERGGLTFGDVDVVEMPYPDMAVGLATGAIDLGIMPEPYASISVQRGGAVRWRGSQELVPGNVGSVLMYSAEFAGERTAVARDFMVAFVLGARDFNDAFVKRDPQRLAQAEDLILRRTDLRDPELVRTLETSFLSPNGMFDKAALRTDYELYRQYSGLVESIDLDQVVDESFANYAVSILGPYR
jgi:NitT/TauT family transport system substrate-binding protein